MIRRRLALSLALSSVLAIPAGSVRAQPPKADDLAARVQQLEKRVAELEKQLHGLGKDPAKTGTAAQVVGSWAIADDLRKAEGLFTDLRLRADGTGKAVINHANGQWNNLKYDVVGKQLELRDERGGLIYSMSVRIASISDSEMVLEYTVGDKSRQAKYSREK
ncbi:MAG: hypothetical protein J2P46_01665 [Zavarzinella sp.]|nr:hypothetical protein [Zavarzinella sp.]